MADLKSAWRGVRSRGWSGAFVIGLLALAIAGNVVMFAFADSLVFSQVPFPEASRIVRLAGSVQQPERINQNASARILDVWQQEGELFTALAAISNRTLFILGDGPITRVRSADVTPRFFDVIGVQPRWGRGFLPGDELNAPVFSVVISEKLARERFGHPNRAPGQVLEATAGKLVVVGVMDESFSYPNANFHVWRALDLTGPLMRNFGAFRDYMARLSPQASLDSLSDRLKIRAPAVGAAAGLTTYTAQARPEFGGPHPQRRTLVFVLAGAALCLLLAACANVASLELANALWRARLYAVQLSLGAPRWRLARVAALEGLILVGAALTLAYGLTTLAMNVLSPNLPDSLRLASNKPIAFDVRALVFMVAVGIVAWAIAAIPAIVTALRAQLVTLLKLENRSSVASRGAVWLRRGLSVGQIAVAVPLVIGGLLYARSYQNLLAVDKGFDSSSLFSIDWTMPPDYFATAADSWDFRQRALQVFGSAQGIEAVTTSAPPPSLGDSPSPVALEIDGHSAAKEIYLGRKWVTPEYFAVVQLPLKQGRLPAPAESAENVIVPEHFARRFFPNGEAVGHSFRRSPQEPWLNIIGVVGDFRTQRTRLPQPGDEELFYYSLSIPTPPTTAPAAAAQPKPIDTGGVTMFRTITVRTDGSVTAAQLIAIGKRVDAKAPITVQSVDEDYAEQSADTRLASQIVGGFSLLAFVVAMAGVYAVMAFLVVGRTREIGVRIALGASLRDIQRLVLGSGVRMVALGVVLGLLLAWIATRWIESELFGVTPLAWPIYVIAVVTTMIVALAATWSPARRASRVDPAVTLRHD